MTRRPQAPRTRLDPLPGPASARPKACPGEAALRMLDIQMVSDAVAAVRACPRGARRRTARKHRVAPATITEAIKRVELAMGVQLFEATEDGGRSDVLSPAGRAFESVGRDFLENFQAFRKLVQSPSRGFEAASALKRDVQEF